jgi:GT2 family glycosyltransferase
MGAAITVLERIGPLDEDPCLATAEDCEYSYRALRGGVPIAYAPDVLVNHLGWRDAGEREATYRSYARSLAGFFGKYLRRGDWFIALRVAVHLLRASKRWAFGALARDADRALNGRAYVLGLVPGLVAGWRSGRSS